MIKGMETRLCPYCGQDRPLLALDPNDLAGERRLDPHSDPAADEPVYKPMPGTCHGSSLIESKTGAEERQRVLVLRQHTAERMRQLTGRPNWPDYEPKATWITIPISVPAVRLPN